MSESPRSAASVDDPTPRPSLRDTVNSNYLIRKHERMVALIAPAILSGFVKAARIRDAQRDHE